MYKKLMYRKSGNKMRYSFYHVTPGEISNKTGPSKLLKWLKVTFKDKDSV